MPNDLTPVLKKEAKYSSETSVSIYETMRCGNEINISRHKKDKSKTVPILHYKHNTIKTYGKWRYSSTFLDFGTRWRRVVRYTHLPLYSPGERTAATHSGRGWVGLRIRVNAWVGEDN